MVNLSDDSKSGQNGPIMEWYLKTFSLWTVVDYIYKKYILKLRKNYLF
jgi:hypothetical protein